MPASTVWRSAAILALIGILVGPTRTARAEEGDKEALVDAFVEKVEEHRRDGDLGALEADAKAAVKLYKELAGEDREAVKARKDLFKCLGILITKYREDSLEKALLEAFGAMGDEEGARYVAPYLKEPRGDSVDPLLLVALKSAGQIAADKLVPRLLKLATKADRTSIQIAAIKELGNFGHCKRYRVKILKELVKHVRRYRPGQGRIKENKVDPSKGPVGANPGEGTRGRWQALGAAIPPALNQLTGQNIPSLEDWITIVEDARRLDDMFLLDDEEGS